jgi:hypothetical protein
VERVYPAVGNLLDRAESRDRTGQAPPYRSRSVRGERSPGTPCRGFFFLGAGFGRRPFVFPTPQTEHSRRASVSVATFNHVTRYCCAETKRSIFSNLVTA